MFDACIYFNLNTLTRKINQIWDAHFERLGLSPSHAYTLMVILESPGLTNKELAQHMELDQSTLTRFVDSLLKRGLVTREGQGKGTPIFPSEQGKKIKTDLQTAIGDIHQHLEDVGILDKTNKILPGIRKLKAALSTD
jgi:MarR family transcriptional regulator, organic hydroperoxide resistance regulator